MSTVLLVLAAVALVLVVWTVLCIAAATLYAAVMMAFEWHRGRDRDALARAVGVLTVSGRR